MVISLYCKRNSRSASRDIFPPQNKKILIYIDPIKLIWASIIIKDSARTAL